MQNDSISRCFTLWKNLYKYAIRKDIVAKDETIKVDVPKSEKVIVQKDMTTTYDDIQDMIDLVSVRVKNKRNRYLLIKAITIIAYTGMRPSEVFALDKSSIDFEKGFIHIKQKIGSTSTERFAVTRTKTEKSQRWIPIPEELVTPLKDLVDNSDEELLFVRDSGKVMTGNDLANVDSRLSKGKFRAYSMRHQFITDGIKSGTDLRTMQELAGHQNSSMTLSYARSSDQLKEDAMKNRVFSRKIEKN